jgi:hypothetical protein
MSLTLALALSLATSQICPGEIQTQQRASAPSGWSAVPGEYRHTLHGFVFYWGTPANRFEIPPGRSKTVNRIESLEFDIPRGRKDLWISCAYFATSVEMRKNLGSGLTRCKATIQLSNRDVTSIECR